MNTAKIMSAAALAFAFLSCGTNEQKSIESNLTADSTSAKVFQSPSPDGENNKQTERKFIRTADLKFKVKDVVQATYNIEEITNRNGGFVTSTNLSSTQDNVTTTPTSPDSSLEITNYTTVSDMTVRVPNSKLDTTLKEIAKNVDYLDFRIIKAEDVSLQMLANHLEQNRSEKYERRLTQAIDNKGKRLKDITDAEEMLTQKEENGDNAKISTLSLTDKVEYSTVSITVYQRQTARREMIANFKTIEPYQPGLGKRIVTSLSFGWSFLEDMLVFLVKFWVIFLLAIIALIAYKKAHAKAGFKTS